MIIDAAAALHRIDAAISGLDNRILQGGPQTMEAYRELLGQRRGLLDARTYVAEVAKRSRAAEEEEE